MLVRHVRATMSLAATSHLKAPAARRKLRVKRPKILRSVMTEEVAVNSEMPIVQRSKVNINAHFDSGNIEVLNSRDPSNLQLAVHADPYTEEEKFSHLQWFYFRVTGARNTPLVMNIMNAGECSFPYGWQGYNACVSHDRSYWFRVPTTYDKERGVLSIKYTPQYDALFVAYFAPYTWDRHQTVVHEIASQPGVRLHMLGETADGHEMDMLQVGKPGPRKKVVWIVARQHPGESMAEWFAEGVLRRLTCGHDAISRHLLKDTVFYVVPNMCPDGTWRGHIRTNALGVNLNRTWQDPDPQEAPEVYCVRKKMEETGVDICIDVHGDEGLPYNFFAGNEGIPSWGPELKSLQDILSNSLLQASPDFQTKWGYGVSKPGKANMKLCSKWVGERFKCLAVTLEMPFKDTADYPEPVQGWSPERSMQFGRDMLTAIHEVVRQMQMPESEA